MLTICLFVQSSLLAQVSKTIHVETAGTLPTLAEVGITNLTLTGNLNGTDIAFIRTMTASATPLTVLNLTGANIVSGGKPYYPGYYTRNNQIGDRFFEGCTGLTSITIPNSVTSIGRYAFYSCTGLREVYSNNPTPPILGEDVFLNISSSCILSVPLGAGRAYTNAAGWKHFVTIIEKDPNGIQSIDKSNVSILPSATGIAIETHEQASVSVYTLLGQQMYQAVVVGNTDIPLDKGVYVVQVGRYTQKVIVK